MKTDKAMKTAQAQVAQAQAIVDGLQVELATVNGEIARLQAARADAQAGPIGDLAGIKAAIAQAQEVDAQMAAQERLRAAIAGHVKTAQAGLQAALVELRAAQLAQAQEARQEAHSRAVAALRGLDAALRDFGLKNIAVVDLGGSPDHTFRLIGQPVGKTLQAIDAQPVKVATVQEAQVDILQAGVNRLKGRIAELRGLGESPDARRMESDAQASLRKMEAELRQVKEFYRQAA